MTNPIAALEEQTWPFEPPPIESRTYLEARTVEFFEQAEKHGFQAYMFGTGNVGARDLSGKRGGIIHLRGRHRWEVALGTTSELNLSLMTTDFDGAARAVLDWLSGTDAETIRKRLASSLARQAASVS